jgi:succinoglycan biosynthesis transport protein ExoP
MDNLEKYTDRLLERKLVDVESPPEPEQRSQSTSDLIKGILRRWYIVLLVFFVMCATGLPAIWYLIKPLYSVTGALRFTPVLTNILTGEEDPARVSMYTEAEMITSERVIQRVADNLVDRNLSFFEDGATNFTTKVKQKITGENAKLDAVARLKRAISTGIISVVPARRTELLHVTMKSKKVEETKQIVDAFINAYMAVEVTSSTQEQDQKLALLENEQKLLDEKLRSSNETIRQLASEYGSTNLVERQDMRLKRVTALLSELTNVEARRINLEAQVQFLEQAKEQTIAPEDMLKLRNEYINSDPMVQELIRNIVQLERDLIIAQQTLTPDNPAMKRKQDLLDVFLSRVEEQRQKVGEQFNELAAKEVTKARNEMKLNAQVELERIKVYEKHLREVLAKEDVQVVELGRKKLNIEDLQFQQNLDKETYDTIRRRIRDLEMERKRPANISVAYYADISAIRDKRVKYSAALVFASLFCGMGLAFLMDKADQRLRTPDDITKRISIPIIGTTMSLDYIKPAFQLGQIAGEYQIIRANLGLFNQDGMPKKLVVTSPGMREGKTTLAINLATSMAESGKKVLLIDGDLRKPEIANLLNLPEGAKGLKDIFLGTELGQAVRSIHSTGLDVLASHSCNGVDVYELITSPIIAKQIDKLSNSYDCMIIDTPPVLAFPDALLWAKIAGAVILTSFAGQTTSSDLKEARQRLIQINVKVLGTVLNNIRTNHNYHRYNYNYAQDNQSRKSSKRVNTKQLLAHQPNMTIAEISTPKQTKKTQSKDIKL